MLRINNLSLTLGDRVLFDNINCSLAVGQRVGLVGMNGAGKSTLLRILSGKTEGDCHEVEISKGLKRAYLPQEIVVRDSSRSVLQEAASAFSHLTSIHEELQGLNRKISACAGRHLEDKELQGLLEHQNRLQDRLHASEFYQMEALIKKILTGLGFSQADFNKKASDLSGGWTMRLELARILLQKPDFIFLDEPTNHLDLPSLAWLENFLSTIKAGIVIVSHDRAFLDNSVDFIWELETGKLTIYKGNYTAYEKERELRIEQIEAAHRNRQLRIKQLKTFVQRFGAKASKAKQAKSKLKQLERLTGAMTDHVIEHRNIEFRLPEAPPCGRVVLEVQGLSKSYEGKRVFSDISFILQRGEKMAVVGPNGAGKSSLLKILSNIIPPDGGSVCLGHNVTAAYFGQHQVLELDPKLDLIQTLEQLDLDMAEKDIRNILATFLFGKEDVKKKVSSLSGGEKNRLALSKIMASRANLLLLDEPTNHLDMNSRKAVENALRKYDGSVVVVSHDRAFLDAFVDRVLEMENHTATLYPGKVADFLAMKRQIQQDISNTETVQPKSQRDLILEPSKSRKDRRRYLSKIRQEKALATKPVKEKLSEIEAEITKLEEEKSSMEQMLSDPAFYKDQEMVQRTSQDYKENKRKLEGLYSLWEDLGAELEKITSEYDKLLEIE